MATLPAVIKVPEITELHASTLSNSKYAHQEGMSEEGDPEWCIEWQYSNAHEVYFMVMGKWKLLKLKLRQMLLQYQYRTMRPSIQDVVARFFEPFTERNTIKLCVDCINFEYPAPRLQILGWSASHIYESLRLFASPNCPIYRLGMAAIVTLLDCNTSNRKLKIMSDNEWDTDEKQWRLNTAERYSLYVIDKRRAARATLEIYSSLGSSKSDRKLKARPHVSEFPLTEETWSKRFSLVMDCVNKHNCGQSKDIPALPSRVLDLTNLPKVKLINGNGIHAQYTTLSYCWGGAFFVRTTIATLNERMEDIPWESFPTTFQEAIQISKRFSVHHIWIDSLCIIQNSRKDWRLEASQMCDIYAKSFLTIAATRAANPHESFLGCRPVAQRIATTDEKGENRDVFVRFTSNHFMRTPMGIGTNVLINPLLYRGWAYQEHRLAKRVLHFIAFETIFRCDVGVVCECRGESDVGTTQGLEIYQDSGVDEMTEDPLQRSIRDWYLEVREYSSLSLTVEEDRLIALSGLAQKYDSRNLLGRYSAGMWEKSLPSSLFWGPGPRDNFRPSAYIAPSWSWVSLMGPVWTASEEINVGSKTANPFKWQCEPYDIEAKTKRAGKDPFGAISDGLLMVRAQIKCVNYATLRKRIGKSSLDLEDQIPRLRGKDPLFLLGFRGTMNDRERSVAYRALILQRSKRVLGTFERIGIVPWEYEFARQTLTRSFTEVEYSEVYLVWFYSKGHNRRHYGRDVLGESISVL